jgi:hypothetical protein
MDNELILTPVNHREGINQDRFSVWRNDGHVGYVHLAMKVVTEAIYDLILGDRDDMISAAIFFYGDETESLYWLWAEILGYNNRLPELVEKYATGHVSQEDVEYLRNLCTVVKTI